MHRDKADQAYQQLAARGAEWRAPETQDEALLYRAMNRDLDRATQNAREAAFIAEGLAMHYAFAVTLAILGLILTLVGLYRKHRQLHAHLRGQAVGPYPPLPPVRPSLPPPILAQAWTSASR